MKYNKNEVTGKMRDRIILQNVTRSRSLTGFASESWADTTTIWAFAESKLPGSNENIIDGKNTAKNVCDFTIRYISTISEESRVVFKNKIYQVKNIKISHDRRFISFQGVYYDSYSTVIGLQSCSASLLAQSSLSAALMRVIKYQASLNAFGSVSADIALVQKVASSLNAFGTLTADINFVQKVQASLTGAGTTTADLTVTAAGSLLLDLYPSATAAYSLRKLRTAYTGSAIMVRRSSDNTEQNIGFTGNDLDTTALLAFCGTANGFVTTWYDQSGNARNVTQATQANQPQIVSSGSLLTVNTKPTLLFDGTNDSLINNSMNYSNQNISILMVNKRIVTSSHSIGYGPSTPTPNGGLIMVNNSAKIGFDGRPTGSGYFALSSSLPATTNQILQFNICTTTNMFASSNGTNFTSLAISTPEIKYDPTNHINIGAILSVALYYNCNVQEIVIYPTNETNNKLGLETNINTHYAIY